VKTPLILDKAADVVLAYRPTKKKKKKKRSKKAKRK